jgi:hypothetical protein
MLVMLPVLSRGLSFVYALCFLPAWNDIGDTKPKP